MEPEKLTADRMREVLAIVKEGGGGEFRGFMRGDATEKEPAYGVVCFDSLETGSTLCMRVVGLTAEKVREHIKESNAKFGRSS